MTIRTVSIHGAPRSGTSWLGELFASHPAVAYRFQPLFSYAFRDGLGRPPRPEAVEGFLEAVLATDDDFVLQRGQARLGPPAPTAPRIEPTHLVLKHVRFHDVIPVLLEAVADLHVIGIIRHPAAVVNSFVRTPREWDTEWRLEDEWRQAPSKNQGDPDEWYGFDRWKALTRLLRRLADDHPDRVHLVRYESLVADPEAELEALFDLVGLAVGPETRAYIDWSRTSSDTEHDHGTSKHGSVADRFRDELPEPIQRTIRDEAAADPALAPFVETDL